MFLILLTLTAGCSTPAGAEPQHEAAKPAAKSRAPTDRKTANRKADDENEREAAEPIDPDKLPFETRVKAPSLDGGVDWLNTSRPLRLADLRGKFVVLDFWTYCCINCMHVLPELKKLEQKYPDQVVVIGVHSAKFDTERQTPNIEAAVARLQIEHPVVNDAQHEIWDRYEIGGWPALAVIDPEGYLVAMNSGEIEFESLDRFFQQVMPYYRRRKLLDEKPLRLQATAEAPSATGLRYPSKVTADERSGRLFISDTGHNRIVIADLAGKLIDVIGDGEAGKQDGDFQTARFDHPQGMAVRGDVLYVADTENHLLRKVDLAGKKVSTLAGTGKQGHGFWPGFDQIEVDAETNMPKFPPRWECSPKVARLSSPWDLTIDGDWLYIAMAGAHQIWRMSLDEQRMEVFAGDGREDVRSGQRVPPIPPRLARFRLESAFGLDEDFASFAQPSGLASDGKEIFVADSEGSAVRAIPLAKKELVRTVVGPTDMRGGRALFTFGDRDGEGSRVRLQHVLGVATHDGWIYIADTYNNKIKVIDPQRGTARVLVGTSAGGRRDTPAEFNEPNGLCYAAGKLYVADTNNHLIRTVELTAPHAVSRLRLTGLKSPAKAAAPAATQGGEFQSAVAVKMSPATVRAVQNKAHGSEVKLTLHVVPPAGWHINTLGPMSYRVDVAGDAGPLDAQGIGKKELVAEEQRKSQLHITLPLKTTAGRAELTVSLAFYYCSDGPSGVCKTGAVTWTLPLEVSPKAASDTATLEYRLPAP
ncbi:MAG: redoxin domain-containing protein [Planctomycetia bacterium]|nr:redoxin domain-containing protein [Planctomycetia bacterium]